MKKCPNCYKLTIPYKWVFFDISNKKGSRCIQCTNCKKNIKKNRWTILDILLNNELVYIFLIFFPLIQLYLFFENFVLAIVGTMFIFLSIIMLIEYLLPLGEADDTYCDGVMSKTGAFFSLIFMITIIIFTLYTLLYKPLVLGEAPF